MKKILTFVLTIVLAVSMLVSCGVAATQGLAIDGNALLASTLSLGDTVLVDPTEGEETVPEEVIPEEVIPEEVIPEEVIPEDVAPEDIIPEEENEIVVPETVISENTIMTGIEAVGGKYPFGGNDVVILTVKNTLETNYSLTATVTYYDADNNPIKTEAQTFDQFAAGYQNYFLFMPGISFDDYAFAIEGTPYDGVCYTSNFTGEFSHVYPTLGDAQGEDAVPGKNMRVFTVVGAMHFENHNDVAVDYSGYYIAFNHRGEIQGIESRPCIRFDVYDETEDEGYKHWEAYKEVKEVVHYYRYDANGNVTGFIPGDEPGFAMETDGHDMYAIVVVTNLVPVE